MESRDTEKAELFNEQSAWTLYYKNYRILLGQHVFEEHKNLEGGSLYYEAT